MKILLDLFPLIAFLATFVKFGIYTATAVLMGALWLAVLLDYFFVGKKINPVLLGTAIVASIFGALTLILHKPIFIHIKPSIIFGATALAYLGSHFIGKKVLLERMMGAQLAMPDAIWRRMSWAWIIFFSVSACINLYTALYCNEHIWAYTLGALKLSFIPFLIAHAPFLMPYLKQASQSEAKHND